MADITVTAAHVRRVNTAQDRVIPVVLAETVVAGQVLYQTSVGTFGVADANAGGKDQPRGLALQGGLAGEVVDVLVEGEVTGFDLSSLDYDAVLYLSDTAGALSDTPGTLSVTLARVFGLTDKEKTKALYFFVNWATVYS